MRIAQIAPLVESCPPALYGGTERVVSYLTEELVGQGHDVTLFASGDSITAAELAPCSPRALRLCPGAPDPLPFNMVMLEEVARRESEFDILHFHIELLHAPVVRAFANKTVTTLHGRLDMPELQPFYHAFSWLPLVSISNAQRRPMPPVNWAGTVYHGLPQRQLGVSQASAQSYLAFLGRISPEKGPEAAIEIAHRTGWPLKIAAKIDRVDQAYWSERVEPMIRSHKNIEFIGEVTEKQKAQFLGDAAALLFPINWEEPFGLVVIEAMACGVPVIAFRRGSVPELLEHGKTGFLVESIGEAVAAVPRAVRLDRRAIRRAFDNRFTAGRMARDYVDIYTRLLSPTSTRRPAGRSPEAPSMTA